jgi:predicted PurR-regulated permease PerM
MQSGSDVTRWKQIALFLITLAVLVVAGLIMRPFLAAIVGAIVIAVITERPYRWLATKIRRPNLCALVAVVLILLSLIIPAFFLAQSVGEQIAGIVTSLRTDSTQQKISDYFSRHPALSAGILSLTSNIDQQKTAQSVAGFFGTQLAGIIGNSIGAITQIVIMLFILFFLYRDRALASAFVRSLLPLDDGDAEVLLERLRGTIMATALGRMTIAGIQGVLGGLAYWLLGVPNAFLWGVLTAVMSMIPAFGAVLVWAPIALFVGLSGHWIKAAMLAIWGGAIVSTIDNFLYPVMVGPQLKQHSVAVLVSILGGVTLFGITGIVLGPLTFTAASTLLGFWRERESISG